MSVASQKQSKAGGIRFLSQRALAMWHNRSSRVIKRKRRGQKANYVRHLGYKGAIFSFEPLPAAFASLSKASQFDAMWNVKQVALGRRRETQLLHVSRNSVSSSLLAVTPVHTSAEASSSVA